MTTQTPMPKIRRAAAGLALLWACAGTSQAAGEVLGFENCAPAGFEGMPAYSISGSCAPGLGWDPAEVLALDPSSLGGASGYANGLQGSYLATSLGSTLTVIATGGSFTFDSASFVGAWRDGMSLTVTAFDQANQQINSSTFQVGTAAASLRSFGWSHVSRLSITASGGTAAPGLAGQGEQFGIEAFAYTLSPVPEPSTWALLSMGLLACGLVVRRKSGR